MAQQMQGAGVMAVQMSHGNSHGIGTTQRMGIILAVAVVMFVAQDVLVPLAIAMLVTFALSPLVTALRRRGLPMLWTVLTVVLAAFVAISLFSLVVASQLAMLAQDLPKFQSNILAKVESLKVQGGERGVTARLSEMISAISTEISTAATPGATDAPVQVEVVDSTNVIDLLQNLVLPLVSPVATVGLVIVVVIFMLLEREALRDRFIRLVGSNDLHRTTQVLEEAGSRVGTYLLIQLLVNVIYAVPIGLGLWLIGVPNATLWALLTLILRFVPYIGSFLAAAFPLFLAFAVSPDWSAVLWTGALFLTVELITSNVVEPMLYGSRTGLSPLAIIVSAIFWTFLWGPLGLVLSTPLTVCLVVLGRHIPQFAVFDILFGDEPVLEPHARLYQRLLAGDAMEATFHAEEALEEMALADYYQLTVAPALLRAQDDRDRGVLTTEQEDRLSETAMTMITDLSSIVTEELEEDAAAPLPGAGFRVVLVGGRSGIDDVAAMMLGQVMQIEGATVRNHPHTDLTPSRLTALDAADADCMILCFLDPKPSRASLLHIRRIKRASPGLRVGVLILAMPDEAGPILEGMSQVAPVSTERLREAEDIGADFAVTDLDEATDAAWSRTPPKPVAVITKSADRRAKRVRNIAT